MTDFKNIDLNKLLDSFPKEMIKEVNEKIIEEQLKEHETFIKNLNKGICYMCKGKLSEFNKDNFCFHWFTYPNGIKKKYFKEHLNKPLGFFNIDAYFRWLANTEKYIGNINDLKSDKSNKSYLETTYKFKNIEWSISIGYSDLEGHKNSKSGNFPHYHLQMVVNNKVFIKFNDFHIPFTQEDLFKIQLKEQAGERVVLDQLIGPGMSFIENEENIDLIDDMVEVTKDYDNATVNYQTVIIPEEGNPISGEMLRKAMKISEQTKEPIGRILSRMTKNAEIKTFISRGDGVPEQKKRSGKK